MYLFLPDPPSCSSLSQVFPDTNDHSSLVVLRGQVLLLSVVRLVRQLPREAVAAPSLGVSKARLQGACSKLGWWQVSLPVAGRWNCIIILTQTVL